ncbi:MAG TPA: hypothetical protein VGR35_12030 [Tepidisphaeraceae bacterium]|nr:hypothetical protein [Tepidisphaeraceae bacterium]
MTTKRKRRTSAEVIANRRAHHEAGHAVVAWVLGWEIGSIEMVPKDRAAARVVLKTPVLDELPDGSISPGSSGDARDHVCCALAGPLAEARAERGRLPTWYLYLDGGGEDVAAARHLVGRLVGTQGPEAVQRHMRELERWTRQWLTAQWSAVSALAAHLTPGAVLDAETVDRVLWPHVRRSPSLCR